MRWRLELERVDSFDRLLSSLFHLDKLGSLMKRSRRSKFATNLNRATTQAARWLAVILIAPLLMLGTFHQATFLSHCHDDHGVHLHPLEAGEIVKFSAAAHAADHGHDHTDAGADDGPEGVVISVDAYESMPTRGVELGKALSTAAVAVMVTFDLLASPDLGQHVGSPGGTRPRGPMDLLAISAGDRLVRTSRALLI
jgi:hypothetical protein